MDIKNYFREYYISHIISNIELPYKKNEFWSNSDFSLLYCLIDNINYYFKFINNLKKKECNITIYDNLVLINKINTKFLKLYFSYTKYINQFCDKIFDSHYQVFKTLYNISKILHLVIYKDIKIKVKFKTKANQNILFSLKSSKNINLQLIEEFDVSYNSTLNYILKCNFYNFLNIEHLRYNINFGKINYSLNIYLENKVKYIRYAINTFSHSLREYLRYSLYYGSHSYVYGLTNARGSEFYDNIIEINHFSDNTKSLQKYFQVLNHYSSSSFYGKIYVQEKLKKIIANQLNKNIVLGQNTKIFTFPKLIIKTNDIKCSHGATIGHIDYYQVNYCKTRGIFKNYAIGLIINGFFNSIIKYFKIGNKEKNMIKKIIS